MAFISQQSLLLCCVYSLFLLLGASMFMFMEYTEIQGVKRTELPRWTKIKDITKEELNDTDSDLLMAGRSVFLFSEIRNVSEWLDVICPNITLNLTHDFFSLGANASFSMIEDECGGVLFHEENVTEYEYHWSFVNALYFAMTVSTTIGYGHISPSGTWGRVLCMLYAMMGIPLTGMLLAWTSDFFGEQLFQLFKSKVASEKQVSKRFIALATTIYIAVGFVVFIFGPAAIFMSIEDWTYIEGVYYAFITLTTIGFGDFVTGGTVEGGLLYLYQIAVIIWIMIGLGYWVMVANFITKAIKSIHIQQGIQKSAEEMKRLMSQMGVKNNDPKFLTQHSKATMNFMLQLSNIIAIQPDMNGDSDAATTSSSLGSPSSTASPTSPTPRSPRSPGMVGIPGITALFASQGGAKTPLAQLFSAGIITPPRVTSIDECEEGEEQEMLQEEEEEEEEEQEEEEEEDETSLPFTSVTPLLLQPQARSRALSTESRVTLNLEEDPSP